MIPEPDLLSPDPSPSESEEAKRFRDYLNKIWEERQTSLQIKITQGWVARRVGVKATYIGQILSGAKSFVPPLETCQKIADALKVPVQQRYKLLALALLARDKGREILKLASFGAQLLEDSKVDISRWPLLILPVEAWENLRSGAQGALGPQATIPCYHAPMGCEDVVRVDLDLIQRYARTPDPPLFGFYVEGNSMEGVGMAEGDLLICERVRPGVDPQPGDFVVVRHEGYLIVREFWWMPHGALLLPHSLKRSYEPIPLTKEQLSTLDIQGIVLMGWKAFTPPARKYPVKEER